MSIKGLVIVWTLFAITIFCTGYVATHIFVTRVMADFKVEPTTGITSLEVKTNDGGTQNRQVYAEQPASNVQAQ